jgi:O-antigen ligase
MNTATWTDSAPRQERALGQWGWPAAVSLTMLLAIVSGGSSQADSWAFFLFRLLCIGLFAAALLRLAGKRLVTSEAISLVFIMAVVAIVCLQLLPLPYGLFASLPGRDYVVKVFTLAGMPPQAMPMTLSPEATRGCLLALMPPIAFFLATLTSDSRGRWLMIGAILVGSVANVFLGLAQRFQGASSTLYLYEITNYGAATGFFSNRNNFAMLLCVSIPLTWALAQRFIDTRVLRPPAAMGAGAVMMLIILMGLAAAASRSGILLGMLALTLSTLMVIGAPQPQGRSGRKGRSARLSVLAILGGAFIIAQFGMTGILRILDSDPLKDIRSELRHATALAASEYFPVGSGFGTFRAVYTMHEAPSSMIDEYVNHAHNDWLELWLEGGLPAAALMAAFIILFSVQAIRVWNPRGIYAPLVLPRAASIGALVLLLHSIVEFPLRMPALACIFAAMLALMMAAPSKPPAQHSSRTRRPRHEDTEDDTPPAPAAPVLAEPPVFRVPRSETGNTLGREAGAPNMRQQRR